LISFVTCPWLEWSGRRGGFAMGVLTNHLLRQLLVELGFEQGAVTAKNHRVFRHPESGCVLFLPENRLSERPRPADVVGIRADLAYRGHLDEETFDRFVEEGKLPATAK
jgi:hypothetical protein